MIDAGEVYESTKAAFLDALAQQPKKSHMMRIDPFEAEDEDGSTVQVIGVIDDDDMMRFIVIETGDDGQIFPISRTEIYRKGTA